jgi:hypothetical protein
VDKSLVLKVKEDANDVASYRLHETMREYAGLKVQAAGEQDAVELRCADYYRGKCARAPEEARYQLVEWLDWMNLEIDNIRAVLQRCVAHKDGYRGLELVGLIGWYWITRAASEGIRWLDELLPFGGATPQARAIAHFLRGFLALHQFDPKAAVPALDQAATAAQEADYVSMHSQSLSMAAVAHGMAGDRAAAKRSLAAAQAVTTDLYPPRVLLLQAQALNALLEGDLDTVRSATSEGVRASREAGDLYSLDQLLLNLGLVALRNGDLDEAKPPLTESLRIARQIDDRLAQYCLLDALGCHAAGSGQPRLAAQLLGAAEAAQAGVGGSILPHIAPVGGPSQGINKGHARLRHLPGRIRSRQAPGPGRRDRSGPRRTRPGHGHGSSRSGDFPARETRSGGRPPSRQGPEQQADRGPPVHLRAHRGQPHPQHPEQARRQLPRPDRRLDRVSRSPVACGCQILRSPYATCAYSWTSPPRRSRRTTLPGGARTTGTPGPRGGACPKARCGRWPL